MAKLSLTISERVYAIALLNQFKGNIDTLVDILDDIKVTRITEEEWEKAEKKVNTSVGEEGQPVTSWTWNDEKGGEKEIEVSKSTKEYLVGKIKELDDKGQLTLQDRAAITLLGKLNKK